MGASATVGLPLGADTLFLLVTAQKLGDTRVLVEDNVETGTRGAGRFDELITEMNDAGTRGPREVPVNWLVQQLVIPTRQ